MRWSACSLWVLEILQVSTGLVFCWLVKSCRWFRFCLSDLWNPIGCYRSYLCDLLCYHVLTLCLSACYVFVTVDEFFGIHSLRLFFLSDIFTFVVSRSLWGLNSWWIVHLYDKTCTIVCVECRYTRRLWWRLGRNDEILYGLSRYPFGLKVEICWYFLAQMGQVNSLSSVIQLLGGKPKIHLSLSHEIWRENPYAPSHLGWSEALLALGGCEFSEAMNGRRPLRLGRLCSWI